jgi:hypothetical protein
MEHIKTECKDDSCGGMCSYCCLFICSTCHLGEGCLTSECPGTPSGMKSDAVYDGQTDFCDGKWVSSCSPHSPMYRRRMREGANAGT